MPAEIQRPQSPSGMEAAAKPERSHLRAEQQARRPTQRIPTAWRPGILFATSMRPAALPERSHIVSARCFSSRPGWHQTNSGLGAAIGNNNGSLSNSFNPIFGETDGTSSVEANVQARFRFASSVQNLRAYLAANASAATVTVNFRDGGVNGQNTVAATGSR